MKIKLDENLPISLVPLLASYGLVADTVQDEGLSGHPDSDVWAAAQQEGRFLVTQDLDFSDRRRFPPGSHHGLLLLRLAQPGVSSLRLAIDSVGPQIPNWARCLVILTDRKLRVLRP